MLNYVFYFAIVMFLFPVTNCLDAQTQKNCTNSLDSAEYYFDNGLLENVPVLLWPCIEEGFTREEKISAYKLLVLAYLYDNNQTGAENAMVEFILDFPNYDLRPNDPVEFEYLFQSYVSVPKFSFGLRAGSNITKTFVYNYQSVAVSPDYSDEIGYGPQVAVTLSKNVSKRIGLHLDGEFSQSNFTFINNIAPVSTVEFSEKQSRFSVPLYFSYTPFGSTLAPYILLGGFADYLLASKGLPVRIIDNGIENQVITGPEQDLLLERNTYDYGGLAGLGIKYPLAKGNLFFDVRLKVGLTDQSKEEDHPNPLLWSGYYYLDSDFITSGLFLNFGYVHSIYKPEKK